VWPRPALRQAHVIGRIVAIDTRHRRGRHGRQRRSGRRTRGRLDQTLLDRTQQLLQRDGFFEKGLGAVLGGFHGGVDGAVAGHHDDRHVELAARVPFLQQGDAVDIGHPDVEQDQIGADAVTRQACLTGVFRQLNGMALVAQDFLQEGTDAHFVVNDKDGGHE
jgi:hypothetical protein